MEKLSPKESPKDARTVLRGAAPKDSVSSQGFVTVAQAIKIMKCPSLELENYQPFTVPYHGARVHTAPWNSTSAHTSLGAVRELLQSQCG